MSERRALVLGGGGVAGLAWEIGVLAGLAYAGADVTDADLLVGTSAGSVAGAQLGSGLPIEDLYRRQADPALQNPEILPAMTTAEFAVAMTELAGRCPDPHERLRRTCAAALDAPTVPEAVRRKVIAGRLPSHAWPHRELKIVAVDTRTFSHRVFTKHSGVDLVDAVAASCAAPMIWPPATIDGTRYIDGGVRSSANADLAAGHDRILIIGLPHAGLMRQADHLGRRAEVAVITPDPDSLAAMGGDLLDPATRTPAARAGRAQGVRAAAETANAWRGTNVARTSPGW